MKHRILSLDPGTDNFGFAALAVERQAFRVVRCGMISETLKELKEPEQLQTDVRAYVKRMNWLIRKSKATIVGAERYVPRRQGISNESVNMMLGHLVASTSVSKISTSLFLAATWKLRLKKVLDIEALYAKVRPVPNHVVDAVFIGLFTAERLQLYSLDKLKSTRQQAALCTAITKSFSDFRTSKKQVKHRPGTRARSRRRQSK